MARNHYGPNMIGRQLSADNRQFARLAGGFWGASPYQHQVVFTDHLVPPGDSLSLSFESVSRETFAAAMESLRTDDGPRYIDQYYVSGPDTTEHLGQVLGRRVVPNQHHYIVRPGDVLMLTQYLDGEFRYWRVEVRSTRK